MRKRLAIVVGLLVSAVLLGGCVSIQSVTSAQQDVVGKVRLTLTVCATGFDNGDDPDPEEEDHPGCSVALGNYTAYPYPGDGDSYQLLLAIRVPVGTGVPETVFATPVPAPPASGTITARRDVGYESAIQAALPPPPGTQWVGYLSDPYDFSDGADNVPAQSSQVVVDLSLPPTADGGPFVGPLQVRPVVGARQVLPGTLAADRPVDCGTSPFTSSDDLTVCVDSPAPVVISGAPYNAQTRDFGIVAGNATASAGQTVSLPFGVRGAGALPAGLTVALTATTTLPGAGAEPSVPSAPLSNGSDTRVTVPVTIPADAAAGDYDVVLTGRLDNGQERRNVARLTVRPRPSTPGTTPPRDITKPAISKLAIKPKAFKPATKRRPKRGADVSYRLSEAARVRVAVERCAKYAKPKAKKKGAGKRGKSAAKRRCLRFAAMRGAQTKAGEAGANGFRFNGKVDGKTLKAGPYKLVLTATDPAANVSAATRIAFVVR
jgi:hypothetical protein